MTTGFFQFFNNKAQHADGRDASTKKARNGRERSALKPRRLLTETLEERQLLAVDVLGAYDAILATESAATIVNITSNDCSIDSIKAAIQAAAVTPEDEIIRVPAGTLEFASAADVIEVDYDASAYGSITIEAVGGDVTFDANGFSRVFTIKNGNVTLQSINIIEGSADYGGAIANAGTLALKDVELLGNAASVAGGAIANKGVLTIQDSIVMNNSAAGDGAAIYEGDFAWPQIETPEWTSQIPDQVGPKGQTLNIDLSEYCSEGPWTYSFTCSNPNAAIFAAKPTISNGVLTLTFLSEDQYQGADNPSMLDLSAVEFIVFASDGTNAVSQSFNVSHASQAAISISAVLSNMTFDDIDENYWDMQKRKYEGYFCEGGIPDSEVVDLTNDDLYIQVWGFDHCLGKASHDPSWEPAWNCGDFVTTGYVIVLQLTNATVVESYLPEMFYRSGDKITTEDCGGGKYIIYPAYTEGAPFRYADDAILLDMLKIRATDPAQPVSVEVSQYSTDNTLPSAMRMYGSTPSKVDPSQIEYSGAISSSTEPYAVHMGEPFDSASSAIADDSCVLNSAAALAYSTTISNSLIANNVASGAGVIYVSADGGLAVYNATIANNEATGAALYVLGTGLVGNSIVVNESLAPIFGSVSGSNNLINAASGSAVPYDESQPLFSDASQGDYTLAPDSQAANIGTAEYALDVNGEPLTIDLAGESRVCGVTVDSGSYEYQGVAPAAPVNVEISDYVDSSKNPTISWTAPASQDGVDGYYVFYGTNETPIATVEGLSLEGLANYVTLKDNSSYKFGVAAFNAYGVSPTTVVTLDTTVAPSAPKNVKFGAYADRSAKLTWTNVSNATSYKVSMTNTATGETNTFTTTTNSYTFKNLEDFAKYSCVVTAVNSRGEKSASAVALDTTVAPSAPTGLAASAYTGDHTTTLTWNAVDHAEGYKVAKFVGSSWIVVATVDSPSFTIEGLEDNATYEYGVAAYATKDGSELISGYTDVTFSTVVAPVAPTELEWVGSYASNAATLQWAASEGAVGYRVAQSVDGEWVAIGTIDKLQYTFTGLADNQEYVFGVSAYSERDGEKLYSDYASIDLNTIVAPAKATNPRFLTYEGGTTAVLTWTASVGGATGYSVQKLDGSKWTEVAKVNGTSCDVAVEENSYYTFRIVSYNTVGDQTVKGEASVRVNLDTLVVPTGDIVVTADGYNYVDGSANLTWTNLEHASSYTIEQKVVGEGEYAIIAVDVPAGEGSTVSYALSGLAQHTTYQFRVTAANAKGTGSSGVSEDFYTFAPPTTPVASYVYDSTTASAAISFTADYATSYVVTDSEGQVLYEGVDGTYVATGLAENQTYVFNVVAKNDVGYSDSAEVVVYTAAVPQAPTGLVWGEYTGGVATLSWNDVDAETGYNVYMLSDGAWELVVSTAADVTETVLSGLKDYSTYTACVTAINDIGESAKSTSVTLDTTVAPAAPTGLKFAFGESASYQGDGKATIAWNPVDHADGYRVQVKEDGTWKTVAVVSSNSYDLTGLANYTTYQYRVAAYANRGADKLYSSNTSATLETKWIPTGDITLAVGDYDSVSKTAELTWNAVEAASSYKVDRFVDGAWTNVGSTAATTYTLALADNTNYVYRVVATNEVGDGSFDQVEFFTAAAPAQPTASAQYDSTTKTATIEFRSDFAESYTVSDSEGNVLYSGPQTSCVVEGLVENTTYVYTIVASNAQGDSPAKTVTLYTAAVPAAPTELSFSEYVDNASTLSWKAVDSATGYRVYMQTVDGEWTQVGITTASNTHIRVTGLYDYSIYSMCVTAFNAEGESARSEVAVLDTTVAPAAPVVSVVFGESSTYQGDGKATLTWNAVDHASLYEVAAYVNGAWTVVDTVADLSFDIAGLENFNTYQYGVASVTMRGDEVLKSDYSTVTIDTAWVPTAEIAVNVGDYDYVDNVAELTWNAVEHADGYRVEQNVDGSWVVVTRTVNLHDTLRLEDNTEYTFRVVAYNGIGDGSTASATFFTFAPPAAPSDAAFGEFVVETGKAAMAWTDVPYAEWYEIGTYVDEEMVVVQSDVASFTAEGLVEDMEYVYYVRACNHIGDSSVEGYSDWVEVVLDTHQAAAPAAPSDLVVSDYVESSKTATLTWTDNSRNEESFTIQSSLDGETWSDYAKLEANTTRVNTSTLQPGTTYYFRIAAVNAYGQSDWASVEYTVPTGIPAAPSGVAFGQYDPEARVFEMTWTNNADNALYFTLSYSPNGQDWYDSRDVRADVTSYEWVGLTEGQTYQFRVCAWNENGASDYAYGTYEVPYQGKTRPAAPSDIVFGDYDFDLNAVRMSWTDNSDNEDCFYVQFSFDGETWRSAGTTGADVNSRLACNMIPGREYYFRVASYNVAGYSDWTYGNFTADVSLTAPTDFVFGEYSNGRLQTSWSYNGELDAETGGFIVQYSYDNENWQRAGHTDYNVTERVATSVAPGRTYYFRVAAYSDSIYSDWLYSGAYTAPTGVPEAPSNLAADGTSNSVKLTWTDNTTIEVGYNVQYSVDGTIWVSAGNTSANITSKTVASLRPNETYQFRVRAYNYYGASDWVAVEFKTEQSVNAPTAPSEVVLSDYNAATKTLKMAWKDNASNEDGFTVQYTYDGGETWYISGSYGPNVESRTATGLVAGRTYKFRVCAFNDSGASDWAYSEEFYVDASEYVPAAPTGLTAELNGKTAELAWTDAATNETGYRVEYKAGDGEWIVAANLPAGSTSYAAAGLNSDTVYAFRVSAYNTYGSSALSNEATVAVPADEFEAPTIEAFTYSSTRRTLGITWSQVLDSTYNAQYSLDQSNWYNVAANGTSATLSGVSYGKIYYFRVQAVVEGDTSDWATGWYNTQTGEYSVSNKTEDASAALLDSLFSGDAVDEFFDELF